MVDGSASRSAQPPKQASSMRAMSFKMACTRGLGSPSASFSHSAARSLQSSEFNTGHPHKTVGAKQTRTGHRRVLRRERENSARRSATRLRSWLEFGQASVGYSTQGRVYLNVLLAPPNRPRLRRRSPLAPTATTNIEINGL